MVLRLQSLSATNVVYVTILVIFSVPIFSFSLHKRQAERPSPVILVPGDGGSQLEAKLNKPETVHYFCDKKTNDYFSLWLNLELLVPYVLDCWVDNMRLVYNNVTRKTSNAPGVDIRIPAFGNTSSVDWLDPSQISPSSYFVNIIQMLVTEGFTRGVNIRGAPYDFRKAPNELTNYFNSLKSMTEETFKKNEETKVTFICHSMGCPTMSYFFNQQTQAWKDKYVKALISLGGAWGGAVKAFKTFAAGENLGVYVISQVTVRAEQRTSPSLAFMLPSQQLWKDNEVIMITDSKNYTVADFNKFFEDIDYPVGYEMFQDTLPYAIKALNPPGIEVHCLYGLNVSGTIERIDYRNTADFPDNPKLIFGDGDGTVNARSLKACLLWQGKQKQKIYHSPFYNVDHMGILADSQVLKYIKHVIHM